MGRHQLQTPRTAPTNNNLEPHANLFPPPEWLRRTICCVQWEICNASSGGNLADAIPYVPITLLSRPITPFSNETYSTSSAKENEKAAVEPSQLSPVGTENTRVALAVLNSGTQASSDRTLALASRYDRADGAMVQIWSRRAGVDPILVEPMASSSPPEKRRGQGHDKENTGSEGRIKTEDHLFDIHRDCERPAGQESEAPCSRREVGPLSNIALTIQQHPQFNRLSWALSHIMLFGISSSRSVIHHACPVSTTEEEEREKGASVLGFLPAINHPIAQPGLANS